MTLQIPVCRTKRNNPPKKFSSAGFALTKTSLWDCAIPGSSLFRYSSFFFFPFRRNSFPRREDAHFGGRRTMTFTARSSFLVLRSDRLRGRLCFSGGGDGNSRGGAGPPRRRRSRAPGGATRRGSRCRTRRRGRRNTARYCGFSYRLLLFARRVSGDAFHRLISFSGTVFRLFLLQNMRFEANR